MAKLASIFLRRQVVSFCWTSKGRWISPKSQGRVLGQLQLDRHQRDCRERARLGGQRVDWGVWKDIARDIIESSRRGEAHEEFRARSCPSPYRRAGGAERSEKGPRVRPRGRRGQEEDERGKGATPISEQQQGQGLTGTG